MKNSLVLASKQTYPQPGGWMLNFHGYSGYTFPSTDTATNEWSSHYDRLKEETLQPLKIEN